MPEQYPFILGKITIRRFDARVRRYVGNCSCGEKITLSRFEVTKKSITQCSKCNGIAINLDEPEDSEGHTPASYGDVKPWVDPIIGKTFGKLTVIKALPKGLRGKHQRFELLCIDCQQVISLTKHGLTMRYKAFREASNCGCTRTTPELVPRHTEPPSPIPYATMRIKPSEDLTGFCIGHLRVLRSASVAQAKRRNINGRAWICQCALCSDPTIYILSSGQITAITKRVAQCKNYAVTRKRRISKKAPVVIVKTKQIKPKVRRTPAPVKQLRSGVIV